MNDSQFSHPRYKSDIKMFCILLSPAKITFPPAPLRSRDEAEATKINTAIIIHGFTITPSEKIVKVF